MEPKLLIIALPGKEKGGGDGAFVLNSRSSRRRAVSSTGILAVKEPMESRHRFRKEHEKVWSLSFWN